MAKQSKKKSRGRGHVKRYIENKRQTLRNLGFNFRFNNQSSKAEPNDKVIVRHSNNNDSIIIVSWSDVTFSDSYIWVRHDGFKYKIEDINARKVYNSIKLLYETRLEPIKVRLSYQGAYIADKILYDEVVKFLKIHITFKDAHNLDISEFYSINEKLTNLFIPYSKSEYFEHLCAIQETTNPVIPVAEKCLSRPDSFLFTYKSKGEKIFIIWESVQSGLATYVFETQIDQYNEALYRIFDYVSSEITTKRVYLRNKKSTEYIAENAKPVEHTNIVEWKDNIKCILNS